MATSAPARPRLFFVDYLRGWAIIGMVAAHFWHVFLREDVLERVHGESVFFALTFAAGLFFGVVGVSCALFLGEERPAERRVELARRGWLVFLAGFLWTLCSGTWRSSTSCTASASRWRRAVCWLCVHGAG